MYIQSQQTLVELCANRTTRWAQQASSRSSPALASNGNYATTVTCNGFVVRNDCLFMRSRTPRWRDCRWMVVVAACGGGIRVCVLVRRRQCRRAWSVCLAVRAQSQQNGGFFSMCVVCAHANKFGMLVSGSCVANLKNSDKCKAYIPCEMRSSPLRTIGMMNIYDTDVFVSLILNGRDYRSISLFAIIRTCVRMRLARIAIGYRGFVCESDG